MKTIKLAALLFGVLVASLAQSGAQTNLQFTRVTLTDEQAIQLSWTSANGELYQVQYANALATNSDGSTAWQVLYDNYPSQGTNTFIGDFGNYNVAPQITHPKYSPMRFYRILDKGPDDLTNDEPTVAILSPTNGSVATGKLVVTVVANTDQTGPLTTKLYVDGQEMQPTDDGSNYVLNTCEWGNGSHTLFATAECLSSQDGPFGASASLIGHGVSSFVPVIFSNLVTRISFSQYAFQPSLGQTQQIGAVFAANSDWTLTIADIYSNVVFTTTGSGTSMLFNWDGNGNGETNIPPGVYYYYISAQTNGEADEIVSGGSGSGGGSPPTPSFASDVLQLWTVSADSEDAVPLAIYPPGYDTNGLTIFEASPADIASLRATRDSASSFRAMDGSGGASPDDASAPSAQSAPPAPLRPPTHPMANSVGTVGVAYQNYTANGLGGFHTPLPLGSQGPNLGQIQMEGYGAAATPPFLILHQAAETAANFAYEIFLGGWNPTVNLANDQLTASALRSSGSGNPFNQENLGLLIMHGVYGSSMDYNVSGCKQMYFPVTSGTGSQYVRMSDMSFGGSTPTNGLKWMAIMACSSLHQANWQTMQTQHVYPYNSNLHMILGADTEFENDPRIGQYWADYMVGDPNATPTPRLPIPIRAAWYQAASDAYHFSDNPNLGHTLSVMRFATVYDTSCTSDYLQSQTNTVLSGSWGKDASQVYP